MYGISCIECQPLKVLKNLDTLRAEEFFAVMAAKGTTDEVLQQLFFDTAEGKKVSGQSLEEKIKALLAAGKICKGCPFGEVFVRLR